MTGPLNPVLYRNLKRLFGSVVISNAGQAMIARYVPNPARESSRPGEMAYDLVIDSAGEYYCVNCDKCGDTRHRLYINHRWGVIDEMGRRNLWLMICYNEGCYGDYESQRELLDRLSGLDDELGRAEIAPGKQDIEPEEMPWPGEVIALDKLPRDHRAVQYMAGRGYDPSRLGRFWGVGWCRDSIYTLARDRIIVPVWAASGGQLKLKGWQARYIGDLNWKLPGSPPKWWNPPGMRKSMLLYNFHNAVRWRTGVMVEGAGDAWSVGPMAFATFGSTLSRRQESMIISGFRNRTLVVMWDPDVQKDPRKKEAYDDMVERLRNCGAFAGVVSVVLPDGTDPGSTPRHVVRKLATEQARLQGVTVDWRQR